MQAPCVARALAAHVAGVLRRCGIAVPGHVVAAAPLAVHAPPLLAARRCWGAARSAAQPAAPRAYTSLSHGGGGGGDDDAAAAAAASAAAAAPVPSAVAAERERAVARALRMVANRHVAAARRVL
jgi:hypothetical protein